MKRALVLIGCLFAPGFVLAQSNDSPEARALDLSLPQAPIAFVSVDPGAGYRSDPPGTWYGDHSGRALRTDEPQAVANGDWQMHGSVSAGIGWSKRAGSSNWQAADIHLDKTYTDDEGDTSRVNLNISVGRGDGPMFGPGYFGPYGPGPIGW